MHPTSHLLRMCRITLFTRANCSLCSNAKTTLLSVHATRPFVYREVNVMDAGQGAWKDLYEFDTPVVHISACEGGGGGGGEEHSELAARARKLMHRFTEEEISARMDEVEGEEHGTSSG